VQGLYPLQTPIPFIVSSTNIVEDIPHIHTLLTNKDDNPSDALLGFLVQNYIGLAEDYDIDTFDRNISGVKSQSSESVFKQFHASVEQRNPQSPVNLYQRHSTRKINVLKMNKLSESSMQVIYEALVESKDDVKKSHWEANISFSYSGIALDEKTGRAKPVSFTVTQYRTKRLQDEK
jgi:type IV secretory pathway component VirB8